MRKVVTINKKIEFDSELLAAGGFYANLYNSQFEDVVA